MRYRIVVVKRTSMNSPNFNAYKYHNFNCFFFFFIFHLNITCKISNRALFNKKEQYFLLLHISSKYLKERSFGSYNFCSPQHRVRVQVYNVAWCYSFFSYTSVYNENCIFFLFFSIHDKISFVSRIIFKAYVLPQDTGLSPSAYLINIRKSASIWIVHRAKLLRRKVTEKVSLIDLDEN